MAGTGFPPVGDAPPPYDAVVFDCDSTLSGVEGIDELADLAGRKEEVSALTRKAMAGEVALEDVYELRLDLLRPTRAAVDEVGRRYVAARLAHGRELVRALRSLAKQVWIVSGGLAPAVELLGRKLGVESARTLAVDIQFDAQGRYTGFDHASPLWRGGGKSEVVERIASTAGPRGVVLVGDGVTDLETAPLLRRFVAFGGAVRRAEVFQRARVGCESADLAALVPLLLSAAEIHMLRVSGDHAELLAALAQIR
jgi:phosphoserine phosphatase